MYPFINQLTKKTIETQTMFNIACITAPFYWLDKALTRPSGARALVTLKRRRPAKDSPEPLRFAGIEVNSVMPDRDTRP